MSANIISLWHRYVDSRTPSDAMCPERLRGAMLTQLREQKQLVAARLASRGTVGAILQDLKALARIRRAAR